MGIINAFIHIILISFVELLYLLGVLIGVGFLLGVLERISNRFFIQALGPRGVLLTAWIGTPIHEMGHLLMCFIWGHRVTKVKFLQLNSPDGILGYVQHQYNRNSMYHQVGNFFIGLAPLFSGIGSLILGMYLFLPNTYLTLTSQIHQQITFGTLDVNVLKSVGVAVVAIIKSLFTLENLISPAFWIFLIIAISISSHIALSKADIEGSAKGLVMIFFLLFMINAIGKVLNIDTYNWIVHFAEYNAYVLVFSGIAIMLSIVTLLISYLIFKFKRF
jgi:hypothetical protein